MTRQQLARGAVRLLAPMTGGRRMQAILARGGEFLDALRGIGGAPEFNQRQFRAIFSRVSGRTIFDVGAHEGSFTAAALELVPACTVHAFEPSDYSFQRLERRFARNAGVVVQAYALGATSGSGVLFFDRPGSELSSLTARPQHGVTQTQGVRIRTLDDYCSGCGVERIDLLKLDVEGHELEVLAGASRLLGRESIRAIVFEFGGCHIDARVFFRDVWEELHGRGMKVARILPDGRLFLLEQYEETLERFRVTNYWAEW